MKNPVSTFIEKHYLHFNAATLVDAAKAYKSHIQNGKKMMITLAGAMSTAELGKSLSEMIRANMVHVITCTGANLEEDVFNLVAHSHYKRIPNYRDLTPFEERDLLQNHYNRVTDTCIPEEEAIRRIESHILDQWKNAEKKVKIVTFLMNTYINCCKAEFLNNTMKLIQKIPGCWLLQKKISLYLFLVGRILHWEIFLPHIA